MTISLAWTRDVKPAQVLLRAAIVLFVAMLVLAYSVKRQVECTRDICVFMTDLVAVQIIAGDEVMAVE